MTGDSGPITRAYPLPGPWLANAACAGLETRLFYERPDTTARAVCARCLVAAECLDYAIACEDIDPYGSHGIWAGLNRPERNRLRKQIHTTQESA